MVFIGASTGRRSRKYPKLGYSRIGYEIRGVSQSFHALRYDVFRALLVEARISRGITQVALAQQLACPQSTISKVERGDRRLDFVEFVEWAQVLELDVPSFIERYRARIEPLPPIRQPLVR